MSESNVKKILILGASSYIGRHVYKQLTSSKATPTYNETKMRSGVYFDAAAIALDSVIPNPDEYSHAIILLGVNKPDLAAANIAKSDNLNINKTKLIIDQLLSWGIIPVFTSSESVFDGGKGDYDEEDFPDPILKYGKQKVEIEQYLLQNCGKFLILRLARVIGSTPGDGTLLDQWYQSIKNRDTIYCAHDLVSSPIYIDDVVEAITTLISNNNSGIFHIANSESFRRTTLLHMFVEELTRKFSLEVDIVSCSINDINLIEKRPLNVSMESRKLVDLTGISITSFKEVCQRFVEKLP